MLHSFPYYSNQSTYDPNSYFNIQNLLKIKSNIYNTYSASQDYYYIKKIN